MGKKNKKFKKQRVSEPIQAAPRVTTTVNNDVSSTTIEAETPKVAEASEIDRLNEKYRYVSRDVHKLIFVLIILAIIFTGIYFLGAKTTILTSIGDWLYKIGNFQIQ